MLAAWAEANAVATEALHHIRTVKAFVTEDTETKKYDEACGEALRLGIRDALGFGLTSALTGYLDLGTGVLILWEGGRIVLRGDGSLTIGELDVPVVLDGHERGLPGLAGARDVLYT